MGNQLTENMRKQQILREELERLSRIEPLSSNPLDLDQLPVSTTRRANREWTSPQGQRASMLAA